MPRSKNSMAVQKAQRHPEILEPSDKAEPDLSLNNLVAMGPEKAEQILVAMAYQETARQLKSHTASPSTINMLIKSGSHRERMELAKIANDNKLTTTKIEQISSESQSASDSKAAIEALKKYSPSVDK